MPSYTIRWVAALDATSTTQYNVYSDEATSGTFALESSVAATDRGDGSYTPYQTTLSGSISATAVSLIFDSATNFANNEYVSIEGEIVRLGGKSGSTFASCARGIGGSVRVAHASGVAIYKAHESAAVTIASFGSRNVVRVRVMRSQDATESVAAEAAVVNPTKPPTNEYATLYGVLKSAQGAPVVGETVLMLLEASGAYQIASGDMLYKREESDTTDVDGYFQFFVPRTGKTENDKIVTLTIGSGDGKLVWVIESVPDQDFINFIEL